MLGSRKGRWILLWICFLMWIAGLASAQMQPGVPPPPGPGGPPPFGPGGAAVVFMHGMSGSGFASMSPPALMAVADGVVYIACNGKLIAYEAKTLKVLAEATYWTPPPLPFPGAPPVPAAPANPPPPAP